MIKEVNISNFKIFKEPTTIPLSNVNLLTGINGKGKSTVLQVFLLLSQSVSHNRSTSSISLNGRNVRLGSFDDVKNRTTTSSEPTDFSFTYDDFCITYKLGQERSDATDLAISQIAVEGQFAAKEFEFTLNNENDLFILEASEIRATTSLFDLFIHEGTIAELDDKALYSSLKKSLNLNRVHYVSADRIGPKNYYENKSLENFVTVGALGEDTVNVLYHKGDDFIQVELLNKYCEINNLKVEEISKTVEEHTNYWLDKIFQGARVKVESIKGEDLLKLRIRPANNTAYFKPTNVGYGFSYSLPIIVSGLIAKRGDLLLVENPEAHLHPYAQSIIAKFLAMVSLNGVQVIIESHSEHILNGLRIAVKDNVIQRTALNVLYFDSFEFTPFTAIEVDIDGGINEWPNNFFDQASKDLNHLLGI